jgi:hypothetical protein
LPDRRRHAFLQNRFRRTRDIDTVPTAARKLLRNCYPARLPVPGDNVAEGD